tara:strand:- start:490 stop:756 length:267 start_codon:yes stop_codon:yes gene_type:complete
MKKKTIDERILDYMKQGNKISQWDAYELFNYTRLSATIFNLKADGHNIKDEWGKSNGKKFKRYWLVLDDDGEQMGLGLNVTKKFRFPD